MEVEHSDAIASVKKKIHIKTGVPSKDQKFPDREFHDEDTLAIAEVLKSCEIIVHLQRHEQKTEKSYEELLAELKELEAEGERLANQQSNLMVEYGNANGLVDFFSGQVQAYLNTYEKKQEGNEDLKKELQHWIDTNAESELGIHIIKHEPKEHPYRNNAKVLVEMPIVQNVQPVHTDVLFHA